MLLCHRALAVVALGLVCVGLASPLRARDIAMSGFNEDVVMEATPVRRSAHRFDGGIWCWVEEGYTIGAGPTAIVARGLPSSRQFTSATGSGVVYDLQPYDHHNVLRLGDDDPLSGTLTVTPGQYDSLHILTSSGAGVGGYAATNMGVTLNFEDGAVVLPGGILTHDWTPSNPFAPGAVPPIALLVQDRGTLDGGPNYPFSSTSIVLDRRPDPQFALFESTLDLASLGLGGRTLQSITFEDPSQFGTIGVFAIDGTPAPEPTLAIVGPVALKLYRRRSGRER